MPVSPKSVSGPEGALFADEAEAKGKIAVIYDHGDTPPEITIEGDKGPIQTILADGVAIVIVACARGPNLSTQDVVLVERYA